VEHSDLGYRANGFNNISNAQVAVEVAPAGDGTTPAFAPGTISISAGVSVAFLLE